jgi:hypothetical protein
VTITFALEITAWFLSLIVPLIEALAVTCADKFVQDSKRKLKINRGRNLILEPPLKVGKH